MYSKYHEKFMSESEFKRQLQREFGGLVGMRKKIVYHTKRGNKARAEEIYRLYRKAGGSSTKKVILIVSGLK